MLTFGKTMSPARPSMLLLLLLSATISHATSSPSAPVPFSRYEEPRFPAALAMTPVVDGYATIAFTADPAGQLDDAVILAASHPAFGDSVLDAAQNWRLASAGASGSPAPEPAIRREVVQYQFRRTGALVSLNHRDSAKSLFSTSLDDIRPVRTTNWRDLANPPARIQSANPKYPAALRAQRLAGTATVSFIIDSTGAIRVPMVTAADHPEFAAASLEALKQWKFAPPTENGEPINVQAERRFFFGKQL
jgi:TonB family protein